jgi:hypothetical protein
LWYAIVNTEPEPIAKLRPDLPIEIKYLVTKALEKDPAARYQDVRDFLADLKKFQKQ